MKNDLNPEKIYVKFLNGFFNRETASDLLVSIIENSDDEELRRESIVFLSKFVFQNNIRYEFFEDLLVSDLDDSVRMLAGKIIIENYQNISLRLINWIIRNETSTKVLVVLFDLLKQKDKELLRSLLLTYFTEVEKKFSKKYRKKWNLIHKFVFEFEVIHFNELSCRKLVDIYLNFKTIFYLQTEHHLHPRLNHVDVKSGYVVNLELSGLKVKRISNIRGIETLKKLESLSIWNSNIEKIDSLVNFPCLKKLSFGSYQYDAGNKISQIQGLESLRNLEQLNFSFNNISEIRNLDNLPKLRKLYLSHNKIKEIKGLDKLQNLEVLYLDGNFISEVKGLSNLINLEELELSGNCISNTDKLKILKDNLPKLQYMSY